MTWSPPLHHYELQSLSNGTCYPPRYRRVAQDLALGYALMAIIIATNVVAAKTNLGIGIRLSLIAISSLAVSVLLHYLFLFVHEGAHYHLFSSKVNNDRWSNLLVCYWFLLDVRDYRRVHWDHHLKHGQPDDPENSYFEALTWMNLVRSLTGLMALTKLRKWNPGQRTNQIQHADNGKSILWGGLYHASVLSIFLRYGDWPGFVFVWLLPLVCGFPFLAFVRQVCEHRAPASGTRTFYTSPHGAYTNVFRSTLGSRFLGAAGFRQHWYHHFNPHISYTRLDEFAAEVRRAVPELTQNLTEKTYLRTFIDLLRDARKPNATT